MHVFMTGVTGFIGSAIARELRGRGHTASGLARFAGSAMSLRRMDFEEPDENRH